MKRKYELWTNYAQRLFESAGWNFYGWIVQEAEEDGTVRYVNYSKFSDDEKKCVPNLYLHRDYSPEAIEALMRSNSRFDQYELLRQEKIGEYFHLYHGGYIDFRITPRGRVIYDEEVERKDLREFSLRKDMNGEQVLRQLLKYITQASEKEQQS